MDGKELAGSGQWPVDEQGKPMALVTCGLSEKVGLKHYSNVDVGPASITRFVPDNVPSIKGALKDHIDWCEAVLGVEREAIVDLVTQATTRANA